MDLVPDAPSEPAHRPLCRRGFLGLLAFAGAGAFLGKRPELVAEYWRKGEDLLSEWSTSPRLASLMADPLPGTYAAFLSNQGFQHIRVKTILAPHFNRHGAVQNTLPPPQLWKNIVPTLVVADRLAKELGETLSVNSAYRSPEYNATCPGAAKWSQHLRNNALDIRFQSLPKVVARVARQLRDKGVFRGGVGLYTGFVHIDTRGRNADW